MIRIEVLGILEHRDVALRAVSAACKLVPSSATKDAGERFHFQVVSAVSEAFNNIVLHGYKGIETGIVMIDIDVAYRSIKLSVSDWGAGFDPQDVPMPDLGALPESGLGLFIIRSFVEVSYKKGSPNVLTMSKTLED